VDQVVDPEKFRRARGMPETEWSPRADGPGNEAGGQVLVPRHRLEVCR